MDANKLKPLVNTALWALMEEYTNELLTIKHQELTKASDVNYIFRLQGQVQILTDLLNLKAKANAS